MLYSHASGGYFDGLLAVSIGVCKYDDQSRKQAPHPSFPILPEVQCQKKKAGGGGDRKEMREEAGQEKFTKYSGKNKHQNSSKNYFLLSHHIFRQPYSKRARFSVTKENRAHSDPLLLRSGHEFDRRFQGDCLGFLFFINSTLEMKVGSERGIQKLSAAPLTADKKIQVPKPNHVGCCNSRSTEHKEKNRFPKQAMQATVTRSHGQRI